MAHDPHAGAHASADDEYLVTPPGSSYEHTDANIGIIVKFGLWLVISAVVVHVGMWLMFKLFVEQREEAPATQPFPIAVGQEPRLPAAPRLQQFPENEAYEFRLQERGRTESYGWVDKAAGRVHIPIAEAMRLTVERGLPARATQPAAPPSADAPAQPAPSQTDPALIPADSSAGRTMERRR
jgi:hypothetical protein